MKKRRTSLEDRGAELMGQAGQDPVGRFLLRLVAPGARREVNRLEARVSGFLGGISKAFLSVEGDRDERVKVEEVIDAEIVDEPRVKRKK
jgi:hypothetical protein